jgi:hypothetical protein
LGSVWGHPLADGRRGEKRERRKGSEERRGRKGEGRKERRKGSGLAL